MDIERWRDGAGNAIELESDIWQGCNIAGHIKHILVLPESSCWDLLQKRAKLTAKKFKARPDIGKDKIVKSICLAVALSDTA